MGSFSIGSIVAYLELNNKSFETALTKAKTDVTSFSGHVLRNSTEIKQIGTGMTAVGTRISAGFRKAAGATIAFNKAMVKTAKYRKQSRKIEKADQKKRLSEKKQEIEKTKTLHKQLDDFTKTLRNEQNRLRIEKIRERDGDRAAELERIRIWRQDQLQILETKFANGLIEEEKYQQARELLENTTAEKINKAEENLESKRDHRREQRRKKIQDFTEKWSSVVSSTIGALQKVNEAYTQVKLNNLEKWYQAEKQRITDNVSDEGEREAQLESLQSQYDAKKAAIETASAKREKALNIASAIANTAVAVTKAATSAPWPFNIPAIIFAAATGAAQLAILGKAYSGPGESNFAPGSGSGSGTGSAPRTGEGTRPTGGGRRGNIDIGAGGKRGALPQFAAGTPGWIKPPPLSIVGEQGIELLQFENSSMKITPITGTNVTHYSTGKQHIQHIQPPAEPNINITFNIHNIFDAAHLDEIITNRIAPKLETLIRTGYLNVDRG